MGLRERPAGLAARGHLDTCVGWLVLSPHTSGSTCEDPPRRSWQSVPRGRNSLPTSPTKGVGSADRNRTPLDRSTGMSVEAMAWALRQTTGSTTRKAVLLSLADRANFEWQCWPSQATIAAETEMTDRNVRRILAELEAGGFIHRERRPGPGGHRSSDMITLLNPTGQDVRLAPNRTSDASQPDTTRHPNRTPMSGEPSENHQEPSSSVPSGDDDSFEKFWKRYPHNGNDVKQKALMAWRAMIRRGDLDTLRAAWPAWAREIESRELKHRPHASTFLSKKYYENEVGTAEPPVRRQQERAPIASSDNQPGGILHGD